MTAIIQELRKKSLSNPCALEPERSASKVDVLEVEQTALGTYGYRNITFIVVTYLDMGLIVRPPQRRKTRSAMQ
jgi:hypothetical protein